jgi:hypothetical protein
MADGACIRRDSRRMDEHFIMEKRARAHAKLNIQANKTGNFSEE